MPDNANVPHRSTVVDMYSGEPFVPEKASTKQDYTPVSKHRLGKLCIYIYSYIYIYIVLYDIICACICWTIKYVSWGSALQSRKITGV